MAVRPYQNFLSILKTPLRIITTKNKTLSLRLPESLIELADLHSCEQRSDRSTTLRQWLYHGAEDYALKLVEAGRLSAGRAAELLDLNIYDIYDKAKARGLEIGSTPEQFRESVKYAGLLKLKGKE
jgi:hypothetical protein